MMIDLYARNQLLWSIIHLLCDANILQRPPACHDKTKPRQYYTVLSKVIPYPITTIRLGADSEEYNLIIL